MERIEARVSIDRSLVPHFWIWSGKRAEGEERESYMPFTIGDFVVSRYLGLQFVSDKHCAMRYNGLKLSGIATDNDEIDVPLGLIDFDVAIIVNGEVKQNSIAGKYSMIGWVTAKELISSGHWSRSYGSNGRRYFGRDLRPIEELNSAIASGNIVVDLEEEVAWWSK